MFWLAVSLLTLRGRFCSQPSSQASPSPQARRDPVSQGPAGACNFLLKTHHPLPDEGEVPIRSKPNGQTLHLLGIPLLLPVLRTSRPNVQVSLLVRGQFVWVIVGWVRPSFFWPGTLETWFPLFVPPLFLSPVCFCALSALFLPLGCQARTSPMDL